MTKHCDTCGRVIDAAHPFRFCPECLFGDVPDGAAPVAAPPAQAATGLPRLFVRLDFFQKYDILERVAGGGQGEIWKVWDFEFRRIIAMKRLGTDAVPSESDVYRFLAEAQIASQLEHPGILPIFDVGLDPDGRPFYTTQLLPGTTLADVWCAVHQPRGSRREGSPEHSNLPDHWTLRRALELLRHVCDVMAYAHGRGAIHRDLKPSNILVGPFADVRIIDWGSAQVLAGAPGKFEESFVSIHPPLVQTDRQETIAADPRSPLATANTGGTPLTIVFVPPEILSGRLDQPGPRTDVYSLGVILYELLAERLPYSRPDGKLPGTQELRELIKAGPPPPVRSIKTAISRDLAAIAGKAMAHNSAARYPTMQELADDLRAALEIRPVSARHPGPLLKLQKWVQRNISYVFLGTLIVAVASIAGSVTHGLKIERNAARQITALREAEMDTRSGRWREALGHWNAAEAAGYTDAVHLGLMRAEAWIILQARDKARAEFQKLLPNGGRARLPPSRDQIHPHLTPALSPPAEGAEREKSFGSAGASPYLDLGSQRSAILLRVGEFEMFDHATFEQGVQHVREALTNGLDAADAALARGLIADSTPAALSFFKTALELDPYLHSAHRHSLGLEFALGRHDELASHLRVARALYPGDFSHGVIQAAESALLGRTNETQIALDALRTSSSPGTYARVEKAVHFLRKAVGYFEVGNYFGVSGPNGVSKADLVSEATQIFLARNMGDATNAARGPLPQLPCVEQGIGAGFDGIKDLALASVLGGAGRIDAALEKIRDGWRHHPEALMPVFAGVVVLENLQPRSGPREVRLLALQAEMYQMGTDSSSILPNLSRLGRLLAMDVQVELALSSHTNAAAFRSNCVANLRRATLEPRLSSIECRAFSRRSFDLDEFDLDRQFLTRWQQLTPDDPSLLRNRIRLEVATGAFGPALKLIEHMLTTNPNDKWAAAERKKILQKLKELNETLRQPANEAR